MSWQDLPKPDGVGDITESEVDLVDGAVGERQAHPAPGERFDVGDGCA